MALFLQRRRELKLSRPDSMVEPHQELLDLIATIGEDGRDDPGRPDRT